MWVEFSIFGTWLLAVVFCVIQIHQAGGYYFLPIDGWQWPQLLGYFAVAELIFFVCCHTNWISSALHSDKSTTAFIQVLTLVASRTLLYTFTQLSCRNWPRLRQSLTRVEFRSILGLVLFAVLSDLVFLSSENLEGEDVLPLVVVQSIVWATAGWRSWQQWRQVNWFFLQLDPRGQKWHKYRRIWWFHISSMILMATLISIEVALLVVMVVWAWQKPVLIYSISQGTISLLSMAFWLACNYLGVL